MKGLKRTYPAVRYGTRASYGGSQSMCKNPELRRCACGIVAVLDLLRYLLGDAAPMAAEDYERHLQTLRRRYLPLLPRLGINGLMLVWGLNRLLRRLKLPYRARWGVRARRLFAVMEQLLEQDLPVIFSVGPNLPWFWRKHKLTFYTHSEDGYYHPSTATKAHYVTVTGMDEAWLRISSWGREYYIARAEYEAYVKQHSSFLVSNLVLLQEK